MVPSRFVRWSLESGRELGELENMAFRIHGADPASRLFSSEKRRRHEGRMFLGFVQSGIAARLFFSADVPRYGLGAVISRT